MTFMAFPIADDLVAHVREVVAPALRIAGAVHEEPIDNPDGMRSVPLVSGVYVHFDVIRGLSRINRLTICGFEDKNRSGAGIVIMREGHDGARE